MSIEKDNVSDINLSELSVEELRVISERINTEIEQKKRDEVIDAYEGMQAKAKSLGFDNLESLHAVYVELKSDSKKTKNRAPVVPVYRNKENESETWTGRGKPPRWLVTIAADRGVDVVDILDEYRI